MPFPLIIDDLEQENLALYRQKERTVPLSEYKKIAVGKLKDNDTRKSIKINEVKKINIGGNDEHDTDRRLTDKRRSIIRSSTQMKETENKDALGYGGLAPCQFQLNFVPKKPKNSMKYRNKLRPNIKKVKMTPAFRRERAKHKNEDRTTVKRILPRLRSETNRLGAVTPIKLPSIRTSGSYPTKRTDIFKISSVLPSIEKQSKSSQATKSDYSSANVHQSTYRKLNTQARTLNIAHMKQWSRSSGHSNLGEGNPEYSRQVAGKHTYSMDKGLSGYGSHQRGRRPSLENVAFIATISASLIGSHRRRQARRRCTAAWGRLSKGAKEAELWTRLQSRKLNSICFGQKTIDKWYKVTSEIQVRMRVYCCVNFI